MILILSLACASREDDPEVAAVLDLEGLASQGAPLYAENCSTCHGEDASGLDRGPDLRNFTAAGEPRYVEQVLYGTGYSMPGFRQTLADQEIADIVAWLHEQ